MRFIDNSDQTIMDTKTGLMWQKKDAGSMYWQKAIDNAKELNLAGYEDWRLPTIEELLTLVDFGKYNPATDFPETPSKWFWSSSLYAPYSDAAWGVYFGSGYMSYVNKSKDHYVRCVRKGSEKD